MVMVKQPFWRNRFYVSFLKEKLNLAVVRLDCFFALEDFFNYLKFLNNPPIKTVPRCKTAKNLLFGSKNCCQVYIRFPRFVLFPDNGMHAEVPPQCSGQLVPAWWELDGHARTLADKGREVLLAVAHCMSVGGAGETRRCSAFSNRPVHQLGNRAQCLLCANGRADGLWGSGGGDFHCRLLFLNKLNQKYTE